MNFIQDYWKAKHLFGVRVFLENMSRNRFLLLRRTSHFALSLVNNQYIIYEQRFLEFLIKHLIK